MGMRGTEARARVGGVVSWSKGLRMLLLLLLLRLPRLLLLPRHFDVLFREEGREEARRRGKKERRKERCVCASFRVCVCIPRLALVLWVWMRGGEIRRMGWVGGEAMCEHFPGVGVP